MVGKKPIAFHILLSIVFLSLFIPILDFGDRTTDSIYKSYIPFPVLISQSETDISTVNDTDGDGMPDAWESLYGLNPYSASDKYGDLDDDNLVNYLEYLYGTNPLDWDTDNDSMSDGWEVQYDFDPTNCTDDVLDPDGDGLMNSYESMYGTNPFTSDTDFDGMPDAWETQFYFGWGRSTFW